MRAFRTVRAAHGSALLLVLAALGGAGAPAAAGSDINRRYQEATRLADAGRRDEALRLLKAAVAIDLEAART